MGAAYVGGQFTRGFADRISFFFWKCFGGYHAGRSTRIGSFACTHGMMIGFVVALAAIACLFAVKAYRAGTVFSQPGLFGAIAIVLMILSLCRYFSFGVSYGRELFIEFIELPQ